MMLLLRRRGLSPWAALFGAASLAMSSFMVCRIRHIIFPEGLAWLSFALAGAEGYLQTRLRRELVLIAASVGLTLLCGALPLLPFFGLLAAAYVLPRLRAVERPLQAALALVGAAVVGLALAGAQLAPTLAHLPLSPRALGTSFSFASSYAWPDLRYLATLVVPDVFGTEERARWFGAFNHWEIAAYYVGLWAVLLSPLALLRQRRGIKLETALLGLVALVGIALAFGEVLPVHGWFYRHVPLYAALRCPTRALVMTMLACAILGAEAVQGLVERTSAQRRTIAWLICAPLGLIAGGVVAYALLRTRFLHALPGAIPASIVETRRAFSHFAVVLGAGLSLLLVARSGRVRWLVAPGFALLALGELFVLDRGYLQPQPADYAEGTDRFQAVDWLLAQKPTDRFATDPRGPFRLHNVGMTYGLESAAAYSSVQIFRYVNFLEVLATGHGLPTPLNADPAASDVRRFDSPLVDLLNVRWVISDHLPAPGWQERFRPRAGGATPAARHEPSWDRRLSVWENPHVLPRSFIVHRAQIVSGGAAELAALARLDPRKQVLLEHAPSLALPEAELPLEPARVVEVVRDRMVIEAESAAPGILVVSEAHYPGWRATVDGEPAELLRADYALRGVALPAGRHRVELRYVSTPVRAGLALSLAGFAALLLIALIGRGARARTEP